MYYATCIVPTRRGLIVLALQGKGHTWKRDVDYPLTGYLLIILVMWALAVMNTELLIVWNKFAQSDDPQSIWQFGQVCPI